MPNLWMVRAGRGSENIEEFLRHGIVALGDDRLGPLPPTLRKDELLRLYAEKYPEEKEGSLAVWASQFMRLLSEIKTGDTVVTFDRDRRLYLIGTVTSEYQWAPKLIADKPHVRRVKWMHQVPCDLLNVTTLNTLGAILTLFKLGSDVAKDLQAHQVPIGTAVEEAAPKPKQLAAEDEGARDVVLAEMVEKADEFIEDAIRKLDWAADAGARGRHPACNGLPYDRLAAWFGSRC
jgi:restriction system protein